MSFSSRIPSLKAYPPKSPVLTAAILLLLGPWALSGCNDVTETRTEAPVEPETEQILSTIFKPKEGEAVATAGGETILTVEDLQQSLSQLSAFARRRIETPEGRRDYIEQLVHFELFAREAAHQGLHLDPQVQQALKQAMVSRLHSKRSSQQEEEPDISDERLKEYFQENISDFVRPERVRVSHIFFSAPKDSSEKREEARENAGQALARLRSGDRVKATDFSTMARNKSDDARSSSVGGDLRYLSLEELEEAWGQRMAEAAFELDTVGSVSDVVEGDRGVHILRLLGRQKAIDRSFQDVRPQLVSRARRDDHRRRYNEYIEELSGRHELVIHEELLDDFNISPPEAAAAEPSASETPVSRDDATGETPED